MPRRKFPKVLAAAGPPLGSVPSLLATDPGTKSIDRVEQGRGVEDLPPERVPDDEAGS